MAKVTRRFRTGYIWKEESRIAPDGSAVGDTERWAVALHEREKVPIGHWGKGIKVYVLDMPRVKYL